MIKIVSIFLLSWLTLSVQAYTVPLKKGAKTPIQRGETPKKGGGAGTQKILCGSQTGPGGSTLGEKGEGTG